MDFYVGPAPARVPGELRVEKLFDNTRVILGRKGHPLAQAKSLRELANAHWITTSITHKAEEELGPLFEKHGLPAPKLAMRAQSALTFLTALPSSDLLMMLPVNGCATRCCGTRSRKSRSGRSCPRRPFASCSAQDCR